MFCERHETCTHVGSEAGGVGGHAAIGAASGGGDALRLARLLAVRRTVAYGDRSYGRRAQ